MKVPREYDLILQGATGFTGRMAADELAKHAPPFFRWAIAGRSEERLKPIAEKHGVPFLVADASDPEAMSHLAARTKTVISCAGPFAVFGTPLVDACVEQATHYADLTGELPWMQKLINKHHEHCAERGITLIPASGFDSVPTDLCVHDFLRELNEKGLADGETAPPISGFYFVRGGFNGGTLHSGIALAEAGHSLKPAEMKTGRVPSLKRWFAPFLMAPVNEAIVQRTHQLENRMASYREFMLCKSRGEAVFLNTALKVISSLMGSRFGRFLFKRFGPKPGEGPSLEKIEAGFANLTLLAGPLESPALTQSYAWSGDPSNLITTRCLVQTGLALAADEAQRGGVLTPASALGDKLFQRLKNIGAVRTI